MSSVNRVFIWKFTCTTMTFCTVKNLVSMDWIWTQKKNQFCGHFILIITFWFFVAFMSSVNRTLAFKSTITCVVRCFVLSNVYCLETNLFHVFDFVLDKYKRCEKVSYNSGTFGLLFTEPISYLAEKWVNIYLHLGLE